MELELEMKLERFSQVEGEKELQMSKVVQKTKNKQQQKGIER